MPRVLRPVPLTKDAFAPFGDVVETTSISDSDMNAGRFSRFSDLCHIDVGSESPSVSIVVSRAPTSLPYRIDMLERHPLGSQMFMPLSGARMILVVAPAGESPNLSELQAFESNGQQGINYAKGTWHMPLLAFETGQRFLCVEKGGREPNCDEFKLADELVLECAN